jgi:hypothetical protein
MSASSQSTNRVATAIDALIATELPEHPDALTKFFERIGEKYDESIRATTRYFVLVQLAWFLTYAVATGRMGEGSLFGIPFNPKMLMISPFLIGVLSYLLLSSMAAAAVLWEAVSQGIRRTLPSAWERGLDCFLAPPTFSNIERMLEPFRPSRMSYAWFALISVLFFLGTIFALFHTTYLVWTLGQEISQVVTAFSFVFGFIVWLRGLSLLWTAIRVTGGRAVRHHRGEAADRVGHWLNVTVEDAASGSPTKPNK